MGTLLLVDDNPDLCRMLSRVLIRAGHQCTCVSSADAAMKSLERELPDLMIADIMMPEASGLDLLRQVRVDPRTRDLPVVIFSAVSDERYVSEAMALGADDYWLKGSVRGDELETRVKAFFPDHAAAC